jgi:outer membrane protein assembly factor BamD (BamD/ComL family)
MSVAGILASSLFSNAGSHMAQKASQQGSSVGTQFESDLQSGNLAGAKSIFAALQQKLAAQGSSAAGSSNTASGSLTKLGSDLQAGNLAAARADYASLKQRFANGPASATHQVPGSAGAQAGTGASDPLSAAIQAYSSLQQNPINSSLNTALLNSGNTISITA